MLDLSSLKPGLERVLSASLGGPVRVISCEPLPGRDVGGKYVETHPHLLRCGLTSARVNVPDTVIAKSRPDDGHCDLALLHNEWAALDFLDGTAAPRFFGADDVLHVVVMEDLGSGASVDLFLVGDDPDAATEALLSFARGLGRLHAATAGRADEYYRIRSALGVVDAAFERTNVLRDQLADSWRLLAGIARARTWLPDPLGVDGDVDDVLRSLAEPGRYLTFTNGDMCPQNTRLLDGSVRFLDFENAAFRHTAIDAAMLRFPFPACPCWSLLPPEPMGFSRRGQLLATIGTFTDAAAKARTLGRLADWFAELAGALRARWPEVGESERVYPAYAETAVGVPPAEQASPPAT